jgi:hypothetical protein
MDSLCILLLVKSSSHLKLAREKLWLYVTVLSICRVCYTPTLRLMIIISIRVLSTTNVSPFASSKQIQNDT